MSNQHPCCAAGPHVAGGAYRPRGKVVELEGGLRVYLVGDGADVVVVGYDIFGFEVPQTHENCDRLADAGFTVAMPDHFRERPWTLDNFPPRRWSDIGEWSARVAPWDAVVRPDLERVVAYLQGGRGGGGRRFAYAGFCWGGKQALRAASLQPALFSCVASVHGSSLAVEDAERARVPVFLGPTRTDPDRAPLVAALGADRCRLRPFPDQTHGFATARGDRSDPRVARGVAEALAALVDFFRSKLQ